MKKIFIFKRSGFSYNPFGILIIIADKFEDCKEIFNNYKYIKLEKYWNSGNGGRVLDKVCEKKDWISENLKVYVLLEKEIFDIKNHKWLIDEDERKKYSVYDFNYTLVYEKYIEGEKEDKVILCIDSDTYEVDDFTIDS